MVIDAFTMNYRIHYIKSAGSYQDNDLADFVRHAVPVDVGHPVRDEDLSNQHLEDGSLARSVHAEQAETLGLTDAHCGRVNGHTRLTLRRHAAVYLGQVVQYHCLVAGRVHSLRGRHTVM